MRFSTFAVVVAAMIVLVAPWLMATFDCAAYSTELLGIVFPATGSAPQARSIATIAEEAAQKHDLVAHARVHVSDPRVKNPAKPPDADNMIQDVRIEVSVERKLWLGRKRAAFVYEIALGGQGKANDWPEP